MANLDGILSSNGKQGLIWWLLLAYSIAISSLFVYFVKQGNTEKDYLKAQLSKCEDAINSARLDERQNILQILKDANANSK